MSHLLEARNASLKDGVGAGVRPRKVFCVEMTWTPAGGRKTRWCAMFQTKALAKKQLEAMTKYPVEGEEVRLLIGDVTWAEEVTDG